MEDIMTGDRSVAITHVAAIPMPTKLSRKAITGCRVGWHGFYSKNHHSTLLNHQTLNRYSASRRSSIGSWTTSFLLHPALFHNTRCHVRPLSTLSHLNWIGVQYTQLLIQTLIASALTLWLQHACPHSWRILCLLHCARLLVRPVLLPLAKARLLLSNRWAS